LTARYPAATPPFGSNSCSPDDVRILGEVGDAETYPFDEHAAREWIEREVDSGPRDTKARSRQLGAAWHGPKLRELRKPVLVLHGDQDPLLRVSAARATARSIAGARLVILPGAGHDLPAPAWPTIADEVRRNAARAHAAEAADYSS
jgi:pimeloyl-ACP methyl ester carboxylesterase